MSMTNKNHDTLETKDFYLASYILTQGVKLSHLDRTDPRRVVFVFENVKNKEDLVRKFLYRTSLVEPQDFVEKIKTLKQFLYSNDK